jgi:high affinity Mn2+ porin
MAAAEDAPDQRFAVQAQTTVVVQGNPAFPASYDGPNSLHSRGETQETVDVTLFAGVSPWKGAELWANPEVDQGFGIGNTTGAAGFPSGEAYKVGQTTPYIRVQRLFFRQTIGLGGGREAVGADLNQLRGTRAVNRLVITIGTCGVGDIFDTNAYAHDPRGDFLNWTLIEGGAFDYAADAWGYTIGGAAELYHGRWTVRAGMFNLSTVPNSERLNWWLSQYQAIGEVEERHSIAGHPGKLRLTGWFSHGRMARLDDAVAAAQASGGAPDPALVRRQATRAGVLVGVEQEVARNVGTFARFSIADNRYEAFEFTDVDQSRLGGAVLGGALWGRSGDRIGIGLAANSIGDPRKRYLAAGGLGILVGDGLLPRPGAEQIAELW